MVQLPSMKHEQRKGLLYLIMGVCGCDCKFVDVTVFIEETSRRAINVFSPKSPIQSVVDFHDLEIVKQFKIERSVFQCRICQG